MFNAKNKLGIISRRYFFLIIGFLVCSISFNLFILPNDFVFGGILGISVIFTNFFDIKVSVFVLFLSIILFLIGYFCLGKNKIKHSLVGIILFPFFIEVTNNIGRILIIDGTDKLLYAIFGGILYGIGVGLILKSGFSLGGNDILNLILQKYFKVSFLRAMFINNFIIILIGAFVFDFTVFIYSLIVLYLVDYVMDKVLFGISNNKAFYIITSKNEDVSKFILDTFNTNVVELSLLSNTLIKDKSALFAIISTKEYFRFKDGIKNIDDNAFFAVVDTYEIFGGE